MIRGDLLDRDVLAESAQRNFDSYCFYGIPAFSAMADFSWVDLAAARAGIVLPHPLDKAIDGHDRFRLDHEHGEPHLLLAHR